MANVLMTGVSGLRANQQQLTLVGNNLANANTPGFKSQRVGFTDLFYETLQSATAATSLGGGTNPLQQGFGVRVGSIDSIQTQGTLEPTGSELDFALQGNGFFVVNNGQDDLYTRDGSFVVSENSFLISSGTGFTVQRVGTVGEGGAGLPAFQTPGDNRITVPFRTGIPGQPSANVTLQGNLSANAPIGATSSTAIQVFDTQGTAHPLTLSFAKTALNTWTVNASIPASEGTVAPALAATLTFGADGSLTGPTTAALTMSINGISPPAQPVTLNFGTAGGFSGLTQFGGSTSASALDQDGFAAGFLTSVSVARDGIMSGVFTNGKILPLAQLAIADFVNPGGLSREGNNLFDLTPQSGEPLLGAGGSGGRGLVQQGTLESSNVDVALEFTRLIIAQRGFQVNARTITVGAEVLEELANIIR